MTIQTVAILSPGEMGSAVGEALGRSGLEVTTCLQDRSEYTRRNSERCGFREAPDLRSLVAGSDLILSILVPAEAMAVAESVARAMRDEGTGTAFADCNAVSPQTAGTIASIISEAGGVFIDAGIIGGPPRSDYATRFYASGPGVSILEELDGRGITVVPVGDVSGRASAIKMCYAALTKGTAALQTALLIAAVRLGVFEELRSELLNSQRATYERMESSSRRLPSVAYRWIGEMEEIASTFEAAGVTPDFHRGAAEIFRLVSRSALADPKVSEDLDLQKAAELLADAVGDRPPAP